MKRLLLIALFIPLCSLGQSLTYWNNVLESDTSSLDTRIKAQHAIINLEKSKAHDTIMVAYYLHLSDLYKWNKQYDIAIRTCDSIPQKYRKIEFDLKQKIDLEIADKYKAAGKTDQAIKIMLKVLGRYEDKQDFKSSAKLNNIIGIIFLKMDELQSAEYHLNESVLHARKAKDYQMEASSLMSLGNRFKNAKRFEEAEKKYKESIRICKENNLRRELAGNYNNYGSLSRMMGNLDRAMHYYQEAIKINVEIGNDKWLSYNYNNLGNIYQERKQLNEALKYFNLSMDIKERLNDQAGLVETLKNIAEIYRLQGKNDLAYAYLDRGTKLKDSLVDIDRIEQTKELAAQFQSERREAEIIQLNMRDELNKQELKAKDVKISYQNNLTWLFGAAILLVLGIAFTLWRTVVTRKRTNEELATKNQQIDEKNREIIDSINYAKRIQNAILPNKDKLSAILTNHAVLYKPKDIISGDFYFCDEVNESIYFGTVDCTGHGVPGAMVSIVASHAINKVIRELGMTEPGEILNRLNVDIPEKLHLDESDIMDGMDMSLCKIDKKKSTLCFAGAYQNCWVFNTGNSLQNRIMEHEHIVADITEKGTLVELKGNRQGIGMSLAKTSFYQIQLPIESGDKIILSTDGFQDQFGGSKNKKFTVRQMRKIVSAHIDEGPNVVMDRLTTALQKWQGNQEQVDDICVMIVEV